MVREGKRLPEFLAGEIQALMKRSALDVPDLAGRLGISCDELAEVLSTRVPCASWLLDRLAMELGEDADCWQLWAGYLPERYEHRLRDLPKSGLATVVATLDGLLAGLQPRPGVPPVAE
jgi:hypothetical protein